jgi:nitrate/nitrite transport system ATP-binding protein
VCVSFISVTDLSKSFGQGADCKPVLRNVSLSVERGEFVCIVGTMGSGKSTLLGLLAGLHRPDSGRVTIDDVPVQDIPRNAAFVFQNYSLLPWFTALENVRLAVEAACPDLSKDEQRARATRALEQVGLGNALQRRPRQLSGGMKQRVGIARALSMQPKVLLLDEPFGALDALTRETLQTDLIALTGAAGRPVTTVMVTNSVEEAILLADRIVPVMAGPPATLGAPIHVTLSRPRTVAQLAHDVQASHMRAHVVATLTASLGRRRPRPVVSAVVATETLLEVRE